MGATTITSTLLCAYLLCLVCYFKDGYASVGLGLRAAADSYHSIKVSSLLPTSVCVPSAEALDKRSSLPVVHKHGPCSQLLQEKANIPTDTEILLQDKARVKSIHSLLAKYKGSSNVNQSDSTRIPAKSGIILGTGNYIVTVGLGTPKKDLTLIFDTGSDITWTQCQPCAGSCYKQQDPIFAPSSSSTYSNISCQAEECKSLTSATGNSPQCSSSTCVYRIQYGDDSSSSGFFAKDTLTLSTSDVFEKFLFGCGQSNLATLFGGAAGLLGLGRDKLALPSQTASKYNKFFSYCLPSPSSSDGFLNFGDDGNSKSVKFTKISTIPQEASFYGIEITGISVGGQKLTIAASVFTAGGSIIDSGTVITRLPPTAYKALKSEFRKQMSQYPMAQPQQLLDTCYDFSNYTSVNVPKISFFFSGDVELPIAAQGVFFAGSTSQVCLAFAGNSVDSDLGIFGNTQQKTLQVVYDGAGGRLGFGTDGCS